MGCTFSTKKARPSPSSRKSKTIKVVHFNGGIQEFDKPITVAEVTNHFPTKHFLFTHSQLLASCSTPLKRGMVLEPGRVYFSLPGTLFGPNVSPVDLAPIARKLMSKAHQRGSGGSGGSRRSKRNKSQKKKSSTSSPSSSPASSFGSRGENTIRTVSPDVVSTSHRSVRMDNCRVMYEMNSCRPRSWKPILDTIREISLNK